MNDARNQAVADTDSKSEAVAENSAAETDAAEIKPEAAGKSAEVTAETVAAMIQESLKSFAQQQAAEQSEAEKLAGMNDAQRLEYERDSYKSQLEALQRQAAMAQMQNTARAMLAEKQIHVPDTLLQNLVTTDAQTTKQNVESFAQLFSEAVEASVKARLKAPTPKTGTASGKMTKEQIFSISDEGKRLQAIRENMSLFD